MIAPSATPKPIEGQPSALGIGVQIPCNAFVTVAKVEFGVVPLLGVGRVEMVGGPRRVEAEERDRVRLGAGEDEGSGAFVGVA